MIEIEDLCVLVAPPTHTDYDAQAEEERLEAYKQEQLAILEAQLFKV